MNTGSPFLDLMQFLVSAFRHILVSLDSAILFGNTSVLDLNIALTVFTIIFVAVFAVVRSGVVNSMGSIEAERNARASEERYNRRRDENRSYNDQIYNRRRDENRSYNERVYEERHKK